MIKINNYEIYKVADITWRFFLKSGGHFVMANITCRFFRKSGRHIVTADITWPNIYSYINEFFYLQKFVQVKEENKTKLLIWKPTNFCSTVTQQILKSYGLVEILVPLSSSPTVCLIRPLTNQRAQGSVAHNYINCCIMITDIILISI